MFLPPFRVADNPFVQCQRLIIGIHAKTVNHIAGNRFFIALPIRFDGGSGYLLKLFYESLISSVMDMSVKHIGSGIPVFIQPVLSIVTHDGVMTQHNLALVIVHLRIWLYPHETSHIHSSLGYKMVMVTLNQV